MVQDEFEKFRLEVREWLKRNADERLKKKEFLNPVIGRIEEHLELLREWHKKVYEAGYLGLWWPKEYGGHGEDPLKEIIAYEEFIRFGVPFGNPASVLGLTVVGPTLIVFGNEEQKRKYLKRILTGEDIWCEGLSEPSAGSDLASIQTTAEDKGEYFEINGQKIWSSYAHLADYMLLLARTGKPEERYKNLSLFIVDMKSEGIKVTPIQQITGKSEFNIEYFDKVKVPKENLIGNLNEGWKIIVVTLNFERLLLLLHVIINAEITIKDILKTNIDIDKIEDDIMDIYASKILYKRIIELLKKKIIPGPEAAAVKIAAGEAAQRLYKVFAENSELANLIVKDERYLLIGDLLGSFVYTIGGGTSEVLRNLLGEHVLKLPK